MKTNILIVIVKFISFLIRHLFIIILPVLFIVYSCRKEYTEWPKEDPVLTTPYCNEDDIIIHGTYSETTNAPWNRIHKGIDFATDKDSVKFQAPFNGVIEEYNLWENGVNWQVNIGIKYNKSFTMTYAFEPMSPNEIDGEIQLSYIRVKQGDHVKKNDIIGLLHKSNGMPHVHFSLYKDGEFICPERYFEAEAKISIMNIVHENHPDWNMCY